MKRVLVTDDSRLARRLIRRTFPPDWEVEVEEAGSGSEAIAMLESSEFDVVFLDLTMPEVDGYSVLSWLKGRDRQPVVIVVSGDRQPLAGARVMMMGAFDFLAKPTDSETIRRTLKLAGVL